MKSYNGVELKIVHLYMGKSTQYTYRGFKRY